MILTRYIKYLIYCAIFLVIVTPVSANIPTKGITSLFIFEKNSQIYEGNINYTINCSISPSYKPSSYDLYLYTDLGDTNPWTSVFTLSGTCPSGNCAPITKMSWYHGNDEQGPIFICELNGSIGTESFTIRNETGLKRYNIKEFYDTRVEMNGTGRYYNYTPEYLDCSRNVMQSISYLKYPCEQFLSNYSIDNPSNGNRTQMQCANIYTREIPQCYQFLKEVNLSWANEPTVYIYRFNLSSVNETIEKPHQYQYNPHKPVEFLYCNLLNFFGIQC